MKKYLKVKFLGSRITGFLCLFCCLIMFAFECYGQQTKREKITLSVVNLPVREVIRNIEKQTDYRFFYSENLKDLDKPVSIKCENVGIESAMQKILSGTSLDYKINENRVVSIVPKTQSKERPERLTGSIVDEKGIPLIGVSVLIKGSSQGTITDIDGKFHLDNVDPSSTVVFSYIGYVTQEKKAAAGTMNIVLKEDNKTLDEVVVVGYGVQKKKLVTGATVQVKGDEIAKMNTTNPLQAMQGQTPGVSIASTSGQPGADMKVSIRGLGTVGNSAPLYLIDGVGGDISTLNPADIDSIDVLKDAASAAIYGSAGANGVVLITTKQGREGKAQISFDAYYGIQNVAR